ncbi:MULTISPECIES: TolC family outer membrane protein [Halorhodospira]|uniref:TolC family outer membrane protein n=1 Tax=Halorhodospira TaxID=85108 RepID=UPI001EE9747F|nr:MULTISPECIES: TolC family outer membrane protein [Halorhodospira]MCG5527578.1 TolC family outer membrane protein [Halorhodospira halophila]MCG5544405.1 TolC family outer membrane protein [Halorhodospira sp. 9628]
MKRGNTRAQFRLAPRFTGWTLAALLALPGAIAAGDNGNNDNDAAEAVVDAPVPVEDDEDALAPAEVKERDPQQDLLQVYRLALEADRSLAAALNRRRAADEEIAQARSQFLPQITASAGYEDRETAIDIDGQADFDDESRGWDASLSLTQPIFRRGNFIDLERARTAVDRADVELSLAEQALVVDVTEAYFDVLLAQDEQALVEAELAAVESQLRRAERALEVGTGTQTDVDEARAAFDRVRAEQVAVDNQVEVAQQALRRLTGELPGELAGLGETFEPKPVEPTDTDHWVDLAQRYNLEVQLAERDDQLARHDVESQRADRWPEVELEASYRHFDGEETFRQGSAATDPETLDQIQDTRTIRLQASIPLFTGGAISSRVRQAEAERTAASDDLADQRRAAALDARSAFLGLTSELERVRALEQALVSARSNEASVRRGQEVGTRTTTDVLDAQSQRFETKRDLAAARYDYLLNFVQLQVAAGLAVDETVIREVNEQLQSVSR